MQPSGAHRTLARFLRTLALTRELAALGDWYSAVPGGRTWPSRTTSSTTGQPFRSSARSKGSATCRS